MPKLYFRYGTVSSAKTLNLLAVAHNYKSQGKKVIVMKPSIDTRFGQDTVTSRAGLEKKADVIIETDTNLLDIHSGLRDKLHCVLVDEVQFLEPRHIDQLRSITLLWDVPVICYGLRTDFRSHLFPGSQRLLELADNIEEVKTTCHFCNRKGVFNLKHAEGFATNEGPSIQLGAEEKYFPACFACYREQLLKNNMTLF
jgi:thymidine kinase